MVKFPTSVNCYRISHKFVKYKISYLNTIHPGANRAEQSEMLISTHNFHFE